MKKTISLYLIITFLVVNCTTIRFSKDKQRLQLEPGQKPGADIIIQKTDGNRVEGELIAVKENSLF